MDITRMELEYTRGANAPALWENGGQFHTTGVAHIIANEDGSPPKATFIKRHGRDLQCGNHALIIVKPGMWVIETVLKTHPKNDEPVISRDFSVEIRKILEIKDKAETTLILATVGDQTVVMNTVRAEIPVLERAVQYSLAKATCPDCEKPHYCMTKVQGEWAEVVRKIDGDDTPDELDYIYKKMGYRGLSSYDLHRAGILGFNARMEYKPQQKED